MKEGYQNNTIYPCIFIKSKIKSRFDFVTVIIYVDHINLIGTPKEIKQTTKIYLRLKIKYKPNGILVYQSKYIEKLLKRFGMDNTNPLSPLTVDRILDLKKDLFQPKDNDEKKFGAEVSYLI